MRASASGAFGGFPLSAVNGKAAENVVNARLSGDARFNARARARLK